MNNFEGMQKIADTYGIAYDAVESVIRQYWMESSRGELPGKTFMDALRLVGVKHETDDLVDFVTDFQGVYRETLDLIDELKNQYKLGILSNAEPGMIAVQIRKGLYPGDVWSHIVESGSHKTIKPERKIYDIALIGAGVQPEEILFIDYVEKHIDVAKSLGWHGIVFDSFDVPGSVKKIKNYLKK